MPGLAWPTVSVLVISGTGTDVGKIALFDTRTYVGIRRAVADKALQSLRQDKIKGRSFRVRVLDR